VLTAITGVVGVAVGALLTQIFAASAEWRARRLEAMVQVAVASGRVIGAHERLFDLFVGDGSPSPSDDRVTIALRERSEAHYVWRTSRATLEIVVADDQDFHDVMNQFDRCRIRATEWILAYQRAGVKFRFADYADVEKKSWEGMRAARYGLVQHARILSQRDARWNGRLRLKFRRNIHVAPLGYPADWLSRSSIPDQTQRGSP
jgi:hypothetical protein